MSVVQQPEIQWLPEKMVEVTLNEPDDFLKVRENSNKNWCCFQKREEDISVMSHTTQTR